ncbi:MAG TPA: hypothetical protein VFS67_30105 [Polyangiaceae bacterium]|nr:hypothetical protein [Polyangiaceae bacterium]
MLFARIQEAFATTDPKDVVFLVLTLNPEQHLRGKSRLADVYREFGSRGERFLKRVRRWMIRNDMTPFGREWVSTVEAHRSGVPHINFMIRSADLAAFLRQDNESRRPACESDVNATLIRGELKPHLLACGFGWRSTAEALRLNVRPQEGVSVLAGYITKIACTADQTLGELAKRTQVPMMAPKNFRRLRSGKGFLPLRRKGELTGALIRRYRAPEGDEVAEAVSRSTSAEYMAHVRACERQEQEVIYAEERLRGQKRAFIRLGLPLPRTKWVRVFRVKPVGSASTCNRASPTSEAFA